MGLGFRGALGGMDGLGRRLDCPHQGPQKSPSNVKDQVHLLGEVAMCDED